MFEDTQMAPVTDTHPATTIPDNSSMVVDPATPPALSLSAEEIKDFEGSAPVLESMLSALSASHEAKERKDIFLLCESMWKNYIQVSSLPNRIKLSLPLHLKEEVLPSIEPGTTPLLVLLKLAGVDYRISPMSTSSSSNSILHAAFNREYEGDTPEIFLKTLDLYEALFTSHSHYGHIIPILQSSGTGKSRLMKELSRKVPLVSVCLRESDDERAGWPPRDGAAVEFFKARENYGEEMAVFFLAALFNRLHDIYGINYTIDKVFEVFYGDESVENRHAFFSEVCKVAHDSMEQKKNELIQLKRNYNNLTEWYESLYNRFCQQIQDSLSARLAELGFDRMIVAIDECSFLDQNSGAGEYGMSLIALLRIFQAQSNHSSLILYWYPILDTNTSVGAFYPKKENAASYRQGSKMPLLPPFVHLPFDIFVSKEPPSTPMDALHIKHLTQFGRALFSCAESGNSALLEAGNKLFGGNFEQLETPQDTLRIWSQRIILNLSRTPAARYLATEGVNRGMRWLVSIDTDTAETIVPSEPILSIAAMFALTKGQSNSATPFSSSYKDSVNSLLQKLQEETGVLDKGPAGELESRLILTMARDAHCPGKLVDNRVDVVKVHNFITSLLSDSLGLREEDASLRASFMAATQDAYINFTHFLQMEKSLSPLPTAALKEAWSRGVAFQCYSNEAVIDLLIVSYTGSLTEKWDDKNLGHIVVQVKARQHAAAKELVSNLIGPRITFPDAPKTPRQPITPIVILMDLGTRSRFGNGGPLVQLKHTPVVHPQGNFLDQNFYMKSQAEEMARWAFHVRGCSLETYPVLEDIKHERLRSLIGGYESDPLKLREEVLNKFPKNLSKFFSK